MYLDEILKFSKLSCDNVSPLFKIDTKQGLKLRKKYFKLTEPVVRSIIIDEINVIKDIFNTSMYNKCQTSL